MPPKKRGAPTGASATSAPRTTRTRQLIKDPHPSTRVAPKTSNKRKASDDMEQPKAKRAGTQAAPAKRKTSSDMEEPAAKRVKTAAAKKSVPVRYHPSISYTILTSTGQGCCRYQEHQRPSQERCTIRRANKLEQAHYSRIEDQARRA